jgi:hypothetical protein
MWGGNQASWSTNSRAASWTLLSGDPSLLSQYQTGLDVIEGGAAMCSDSMTGRMYYLGAGSGYDNAYASNDGLTWTAMTSNSSATAFPAESYFYCGVEPVASGGYNAVFVYAPTSSYVSYDGGANVSTNTATQQQAQAAAAIAAA